MSTRRQVRASLAAMSLALVSAGGGAADAARRVRIPDPPADMLELARAQRVPLLTWAVVVDGSSRSGSVGSAPGGAARPARDVYLHAASVTKPIVATAVMTLVREGRVALDAPVTQYLRDDRLAGLRQPAITIRDLLGHRSGIRNYERLDWDSRDDAEAGLVAALMQQGAVVREAPPGGEFSYADINYDLLGAVLETVTGEPFANVVKTRALWPYGAKTAQLSCLDAPSARVAMPHAFSNTGEPSASTLRPFSRRHSPSGGLCITAEELARWGASLLDCGRAGAPLDCATFQSMLPRDGAAYGFGWFAEDFAGTKLVWHDGSDVGYSAALVLVPDHHVAIAVLTNFEFASAATMARMYAARLVGSATYPKKWTVPAPASWPQYAGMYFQADLHCAEVLATRAGLEVRYQSPDFPYELSHVRLMPKPEWDDGYFIGTFRGKLIWFGDLATPEHSYLFMDSKKFLREPAGSRRCPEPDR